MPGCSGSRWMPRKMSGIAISVIEASIVASSTAERGVRQRDPLVAVCGTRFIDQEPQENCTVSLHGCADPRADARRRTHRKRAARRARPAGAPAARRAQLRDLARHRPRPARPRRPEDDERPRSGRARAAAVDGADARRAQRGGARRPPPRPARRPPGADRAHRPRPAGAPRRAPAPRRLARPGDCGRVDERGAGAARQGNPSDSPSHTKSRKDVCAFAGTASPHS